MRLLVLVITLTFFANLALAAPRELAKLSHPGFEVVLLESAPGRFTLSANSPGIKLLNAFLVENPNRLVLDVTTTKLKQNRNLQISASEFLSGIRFGVHADKMRIVIDLKGSIVPTFISENPEGKINLNLTFKSGTTEIITAPKLEPTIEPIATVVTFATHAPTSIPTSVPTALPTAIPTLRPTLIPPSPVPTEIAPTRPPEATATKVIAATPTQAPEQPQATIQPANTPVPIVGDPSKQELLGIFFEHLNEEQIPVLRLSLSRRGEFRFSKLDDRSYELSLPGYSLGANHLALPQFPPQDFNGMTFLKAANRDGGVQVLIGIERGTRLAPISKDSDILIRIGG